jgi:mRNA-degrading endonuclease RelE of RelBE toxin-antitoxin system
MPMSSRLSASPTAKVEVMYERSFLMDLRHLKPKVAERIKLFVLSDYFEKNPLQLLPEYRQLGSSRIFYRFTWENHLICIEATGQILKFVRVLPKPPI